MRLIAIRGGLLLGLAVAILAGCDGNKAGNFRWSVPEGYPVPVVPADNPMSRRKVELGRWLFYDRRLSVNGRQACADCHRQALAFTDGLAKSIGTTGEQHPRSAMSLVNSAYASRLTWANPLLDRLEFQALTPLFGEQPVEMGMAGKEQQVVDLLRQDPRYARLVPEVFPGDEDPYSALNGVRAIASFVRSIVSFDAPYDRYIAGDQTAMSASQIRGMTLFFSERLECFHCHGGFNFSDSSTYAGAGVDNVTFHNTGLFNIAETGAYPLGNRGLYEITGKRRDMGRFRAPSLRNLKYTAPYMHDGSVLTLEEVVSHYAAGGRTIDAGPHAGAGHKNPFKSEFVSGFEITPDEMGDLLAFLDALVDPSILENTDFADPYGEH